MPKPVTIAKIGFASQRMAEAHASAILNDGELGSKIESEHHPFLEALVTSRPDKVAEIAGRRIVGYVRDRQPHEHSDNVWTRTLWAVLDDGERLDFSYQKGVKALADE